MIKKEILMIPLRALIADFNRFKSKSKHNCVLTWEYLPYMEVLKSGHRTANLGSLNHTFFCGLKLPTLAV